MKIAESRWPLVFAPVLYVLVLCGPTLLAGGGAVLGAGSGDLFLQFVPQREFGFGELAQGRLPLWNPRIFSGMPALGNIQFALCYPLNLLFLLLPLPTAFNLSIMVHLALGGMFMGAWVRSRGLTLLPSLAAGILYLGCGAHFSHVLAGHQTMITLLPWAPLLFWSVDRVTRDGRPGPALAGAIAVAMMLLAGYPQFVFHVGLAAALYAVMRLAEAERLLRKVLLLAAIPLLAAGVAAFQLAATAQAKAGSLREGPLAYDYAAMFSLPPENLLTVLSPFPWGGVGGEGYWGRWYLWETQLFFGVTALFMTLVALGWKADRERWRIFGLAALMLLLALGDATPLFRILHGYAPFFGHFRGHSKWILPASLFLILLAARGFQSFLVEPGKPRTLPWVLAATAGAAGTMAMVLGSNWPPVVAQWHSFLLTLDRRGGSYRLTPDLLLQDEFLRTTLRGTALAFAIAAATLIVLAVLVVAARRRPRLAPAVIVLALLEVYFFNHTYLASFPIELARRGDVAAALKGDPGDYRIHVLDHPNSAMSTGFPDIWGYDPFVPRRYATFMAFCQDVPLDTPAVDIPIRRWDPLLALLRVRYFFTPAPTGGLEVAGPFPHLPRALLLTEYELVSGPPEELLAAMRRADFDPSRTALLEESPAFPTESKPRGGRGPGSIRVRPLSTDELLVEAETDGPALLLLTDPYFPGWRADPLPGSSQRTYRILRADYILQAIPLAAGNHRISVEYSPPGLTLWGIISLSTTLGMACYGITLRLRRNHSAT